MSTWNRGCDGIKYPVAMVCWQHPGQDLGYSLPLFVFVQVQFKVLWSKWWATGSVSHTISTQKIPLLLQIYRSSFVSCPQKTWLVHRATIIFLRREADTLEFWEALVSDSGSKYYVLISGRCSQFWDKLGWRRKKQKMGRVYVFVRRYWRTQMLSLFFVF